MRIEVKYTDRRNSFLVVDVEAVADLAHTLASYKLELAGELMEPLAVGKPYTAWAKPYMLATLPQGGLWEGSVAGWRKVWSLWRGLAALALERGEGLQMSIEDRNVMFNTIYMPIHEQHRIEVTPEGRMIWCSEQEAPAFKAGSEALPFEPL